MKSLFSKLGVILIGLIIFSYAEVWGADWKLYGVSEIYLAYYDTQSITRPTKNIVRMWTRWDYTEKGVLGWVGRFGKKFENLSYSIILEEINCFEKMERSPSMTHYNNKAEAIHTRTSSSPPEWGFIIPESNTELLYKEVCK